MDSTLLVINRSSSDSVCRRLGLLLSKMMRDYKVVICTMTEALKRLRDPSLRAILVVDDSCGGHLKTLLASLRTREVFVPLFVALQGVTLTGAEVQLLRELLVLEVFPFERSLSEDQLVRLAQHLTLHQTSYILGMDGIMESIAAALEQGSRARLCFHMDQRLWCVYTDARSLYHAEMVHGKGQGLQGKEALDALLEVDTDGVLMVDEPALWPREKTLSGEEGLILTDDRRGSTGPQVAKSSSQSSEHIASSSERFLMGPVPVVESFFILNQEGEVLGQEMRTKGESVPTRETLALWRGLKEMGPRLGLGEFRSASFDTEGGFLMRLQAGGESINVSFGQLFSPEERHD